MTTVISGTTGVNRITDGAVVQADLAANVVGNGPAFSMVQNVAQVVNPFTSSKIVSLTPTIDTNSACASSRFTPTVAGYYYISAAVYIATVANVLGTMNLELYKNGVVYQKVAISVPSGGNPGVSGQFLVYMNGTTDYLELYVTQSACSPTGTTLSGRPDLTYFSGFLARAA